METGLSVHAVLTLNNQPIGVRFKLNKTFYDVELDKLRYRSKDDLKVFKTQTLIEQGNLLMTKEEIDNKIIVKDASENEKFCIAASGCLQSGPSQSKPTPNPKRTGKKMFDVVVQVPIYNPNKKEEELKEFKSVIAATNALVVRKEAKEWYAEEHGITPDDVNIVSATLKK